MALYPSYSLPANVGSRTALKALDTTVVTSIYLTEGKRAGPFAWLTGNYSTQIAADTQEGIFIKANAIASTAGAWVRQYTGATNPFWFGALGNGSNEATVLQAWLNMAVSGAVLSLAGGEFSTGTTLALSNLPGVTIEGPGKITETSLLTNALLITDCADIVVQNVNFAGTETRATWDALSLGDKQIEKPLLQITSSAGATVRNIRGSAKRGLVRLASCHGFSVSDIKFTGCFGLKAAGAAVAANYGIAIGITGPCNGGNVSNVYAQQTGSAVLVQNDSPRINISGVVGESIHDNGIYISSGLNCTATGCTFDDGVASTSAGIKARGSYHTITGNTVSDFPIGIVSTGNGATPDAIGANGAGNIVTGNSVVRPTLIGIFCDSHDGLLQRDLQVTNNTIEAHTGLTTNAAILIGGHSNLKICGNIVRGSTASYAIGVFGTAGVTQIQIVQLNDNIVKDAAVKAISVWYCNDVQLNNNMFKDTVGTILVEFRNCAGIQCIGNLSDDVTQFISATAANTNTLIRMFANRASADSINGSSSDTHLNETDDVSVDITTIVPIRKGQMTIWGGHFYVAINTTATTDWLRLNN